MARLHYLLLLSVMIPSVSMAVTMEDEVAYLLAALDSVECTFVRNDVSYSNREFHQHLQSKASRNTELIRSAEDFIEKIATRSAVTSVPYVALCDGELKITKVWFTQLLESYRRNN